MRMSSMFTKLLTDRVNINYFPVIDPRWIGDSHAEVTRGDLHSNSTAFFNLVVQFGILVLDAHYYKQFTMICSKKIKKLTKDDINQLNEILKNAKVNPRCKIRLIGDELADRGNNDYFML